MESSETIDRAVSSARAEIARDQQAISHETTPGDPVLTAQLQRDETKLNRLEKQEDRSRHQEQGQGFGF